MWSKLYSFKYARLLLLCAAGSLACGIVLGTRLLSEPRSLTCAQYALDVLPPVRLATGKWCWFPAWSPDGEWIAYAYGNTRYTAGLDIADAPEDLIVRVVSKDGLSSRDITRYARQNGRLLQAGRCLGWGGDQIFYAAWETHSPDGEVWVWSSDRFGRGAHRILRINGEIGRVWPSPDGKALLYVRATRRAPAGDAKAVTYASQVCVYDIASRSERVIAQNGKSRLRCLGWVDPQTVLVERYKVPVTGKQIATIDEVTPLAETWSSDAGKFAVRVRAPGNSTNLALLSATGEERILTHTGDVACPALSPDGNYVAFQRLMTLKDEQNREACRYDSLWAMGTAGADPGILLTEQADMDAVAELFADVPRWSPRGDRILFRRNGELWMAPLRRRSTTAGEKFERQFPLTLDEEVQVEHENMRRIGTALLMYSLDYNERFPHDPSQVIKVVSPYLKSDAIFYRPDDPKTPAFQWLPPTSLEWSKIKNPAKTVIGKIAYRPEFRIFLFADGHVQLERKQQGNAAAGQRHSP